MIFIFFKFIVAAYFVWFQSYWFLSMSGLCSNLLSWLLWLKYEVFFFLIVGNCDEHMHHVDLSDKNYLSDCF